MDQENLDSLLELYHNETQFHFLHSQMAKTKSFMKIYLIRRSAIPAILKYLRDIGGGLPFVFLLECITSETKNIINENSKDYVKGINVAATIDNWLKWGLEKGYIENSDRQYAICKDTENKGA